MKRFILACVSQLLAFGVRAGDFPDVCTNAYLWLDASKTNTMTFSGTAERSETAEGREITEWRSVNDGVPAAKYAQSAYPCSGPTLAGGLVSFGSTSANRDLGFAKSAAIRSVFMVAKVEPGGNAFLLGDDGAYDFHRGGSGQYWHTGHSSANIRNGKTHFNGVEVANPTSTTMPYRLGLIDVQTAGGVTASQLCYDRAGNKDDVPRRGGKDIAEVLVFTNVLNAAEQQSVRDYLMAKWNLFGVGGAEVVRAHPRLTLGLDKESLVGIKLTDGASGALTNLTVRFDLTNCTPAQIRDVRVWRQKYDPVPFAFFERDAVELKLKAVRSEELGVRNDGIVAIDFVATNVTKDLTIYPKSGSMSEGDYIWVTAKVDEGIAADAEIWASIAGDRVQLSSGDFRLSNQTARSPHRPFPYKYQVAAFVRQDRLVGRPGVASDIFSNHPEERMRNLTTILPIYSLGVTYSGGKFGFGNWIDGDTASTRRIVDLRDLHHPQAMVCLSLTAGSWVSNVNGINGFAFEAAGAGEATRKQFASYVVDFIKAHRCDGLDVDYEWATRNNTREWQNIGRMLREFSEQFFDHGYVVSIGTRNHQNSDSGMPLTEGIYGALHPADFILAQAYDGGNVQSAPCIQRSAIAVGTDRGVPKRRMVIGQAIYSSPGQWGWDGAIRYLNQVEDLFHRYDIDCVWTTKYTACQPFEGVSSFHAQCGYVRREELGGVMSWGYYCDIDWWSQLSLGRHQSQAIWPMPNVWPEPTKDGDTYLLKSEEDWFWLEKHSNVKARFANDILLKHDPVVIDCWTGELDGDGHSLALTNDAWVVSEKSTGLIRTLRGTVKNLTVELNGRIYTTAARWNDKNLPYSTARLVNTTQGENPVGVIAAEAADGAVISNVRVALAETSEVKGVKYAGGLVGKVTGAAVITNNTVEVGGRVHVDIRNFWDTEFQPVQPFASATCGNVASASAVVEPNVATVLPGGEVERFDVVPDPAPTQWRDWYEPTWLRGETPTDIDVRSDEFALEATFRLPQYASTQFGESYPQLVRLVGEQSVALAVSTAGSCELFLTGDVWPNYAYPVSQNAIRGNKDVGTGVALKTDAEGLATITIENRKGELRVYQDGELLVATDKNTGGTGYVRSAILGSGVGTLGGGEIVSVRLRIDRDNPIVHPSGYGKLVFDEEFDGTSIDWSRWKKVPDDARGIDWKKYTSHREDLYAVSNGCLVLTGAKNNGSVPGDDRKYQCGQIHSDGKFSFKYGVVEIRAKFTNQDGAWPAMWMMPQHGVHGGWPESGEIDITERLNADAKVYETVHFGPQGTDRTSGTTAAIDNGQFNVYRLEWTESKITWYVNGVETHSYSDPGTGHLAWPFDSEFYFILSQQLEGGWVGTVDDESTLPVRMYVDYVRVWQKDDETIQNNAYLWLDAKNESTIATNALGEVALWASSTLAGRAARTYVLDDHSPAGPTNANGLVSFGDTAADRDLAFDRAADLRTVFMVARIEQGGNAFLLGDSSNYDFHRGSDGAFWDAASASENVRNGRTFWNGELVENPTSALMPAELGLVELHAAGNVSASQICYDRVGNGDTPRRGGKDIAELVVFRDGLGYAERLKLRKALMEKWLPGVPHPNWSITDDWVLRRENDFSAGLTADQAFADGAGTYEFKNLKLTGGLQSSAYKLRVREGDAIVLDGTGNSNGRCRFAFEMSGGSVTFPQGAATWYENDVRMTGGTFTSLANGTEQVDTSSGFMLGYNGAAMTLDISGGLFTVPDSSINFYDSVTMNISGTVRAKGLFRSSSSAATVNVKAGGRLEIGALGMKANTCALNLMGGTLAAFEDGAAVHDNINLVSDSTVEVPANATLTIDGTLYGDAKLALSGEGRLKLVVAVSADDIVSHSAKAVVRVPDDFPVGRCDIYLSCAEYYAKPQKAESFAVEGGVLYATSALPDLRASAYLWLDASRTNTMTFSGSEITEWRSVNADGVAAKKYTLTGQYASVTPGGPQLSDGLVSFGTTTANRDLKFVTTAKVRTAFMVAKIQQDGNAFFLGDETAYDFHRGGNGEYWHPSHGKPKDGKTYWNGVQVASPTSTKIPNELGLITVETAGDLTASQLCYDRTGNGATARRGGKDIAELLIFEKALTADERRGIEDYLIAKWHLDDCQTVMVEGSPAVFSPSASNLNLSVHGSAPTTNGTLAIVNMSVGAADVKLAEMPSAANLDLVFTMKTSLSLPGGGAAAFTIPSGSAVTIGEGGWAGTIAAADATSEIRYAGNVPIDWPFAEKGTVFSGPVMLACPIANDGHQYLYGSKTVVFGTNSSLSVQGLNLGNENGVTQNLTIHGGDITVTGSVEPADTHGSLVVAHWPSRVNLALESGSFTALNAATMLGWDGHANLTISGGRMTLKGLLANRTSSNDNTSSVLLSGGELSVGAAGVDFTGRGDRNASFTLAGGALAGYADAEIVVERGIDVTAHSTLAAASNTTLSVVASLRGAGDLTLDAPGGTIALSDISGYSGVITDVTAGTHLRITVARSAAQIAARSPVEVVKLPSNVTVEQCTVKFYNADTGGEVASTLTLKDGVLVAIPEVTGRHLTYTPTEAAGALVWDDAEGAFDGETFSDFDSVEFLRVVSANGTDYATTVTLPEDVWATDVAIGGTVALVGETLHAQTLTTTNAHFAAASLIVDTMVVGSNTTLVANGDWSADLTVPLDATIEAVDGGVLALGANTNVVFAEGVAFNLSNYVVRTSGPHYIVTGAAADWPTSTAVRVFGDLPLYKDDRGYFTEKIVAVVVTNGGELVAGEEVYDSVTIQAGGTLVYRGTKMMVADSVTFDPDAVVTLCNADGSRIAYVSGVSLDVVTAKTIAGTPRSTQDFTFTIVANDDGTKTLRATRNLGSARVVRAHPLLTRGVGQESLIGIDFSGAWGGNVTPIKFRFRFENMTADDIGNFKLWRMPDTSSYAFYQPNATEVTSSYSLSSETGEDGKLLTLTYTGGGAWIKPEVGSRENSERLWLTGELKNLDKLSDSARFHLDLLTEYFHLANGSFKVENGIAQAPHRLYPWRYLVTAYMRRDRINGNTIGTLQNAPEMRWPSLTHAIVSAFDVQYNWGTDAMQVYWDDKAAGAFRRLREYRDRYHPQCRLAPSLTKGNYVSLDSRGTGSAESRFAIAHAGEKKYRAKFVKYLVAKMEEMGADGLDIDWEYPDDNGKDFNAYGLLMRDLAEQFFDRGWDLSMCSNLGYRMPGGEVMAAADYMSSMAYGANRGLHAMNTTSSTAINVLTSRNVPRRRIVVGQAMYSTAKWHMGWDELAGRCGNDDDIINEAWSYNGSSGNFIGFNGPTTYRAKANRVKGVYDDGQEYGGIMSWGYYTDTGWRGGKSLGWNQRQTIWPRPYNFPTPERDADGTYVITNETGWCWFSENAASVAKARLAADITFDHDPKPIPAFAGVLDGAGHKLTIGSGIWVVAFEKVGLFQTLNGTVKNLTLDVSGRFICRNDRRNDVQSGWSLSAHGGPGASTAALVAEANAGARIEDVHVLLRKGSEIRGNHEVGVLAGQVWSGGAGIVISNCTVECFGTVWSRAVDSVNAVLSSGSGIVGNGRVGLLAGTVNFNDTSEGVTLANCSATLRAGGVLQSVCGNNRSLGGLVGNMHQGVGNARVVYRGLSMAYYEGASVSGPADTSGYPYRCQPFFGYWQGAASATKPALGTANALTYCGARPSGFDSAVWLDGAPSYMGATESGTAPLVLTGAVTNALNNLGVVTLSALIDLPANKSGDAILAQCTGGCQIWANVADAGNGKLSLKLGYTQKGTRTSYDAVATLVPGVHELTLALSQTSGTTLCHDGNALVTQSGCKFSSNPFIEARFGHAGAGLYAYDVVPGALCSVRYPKKATYDEANLITFGKDGDPLSIGGITYPTSIAQATMKAAIWSPEDIASGPIADWKVAKDSTKYVVEAYRESADSTRVKWRNEGSETRSEAAQTVNAVANTGTKTLNFIHRNDNNGTAVSLNAKTAVDSPATKWGGSKITGASLGLKAGMSVAMREFLFGTVQKPNDAHPLDGLAEEPAWYPSASSGMRDYYRDAVVDSLGTYEPPTVTINGKEVTGGESAKVVYLYGGDRTESADYKLELDAPVVGNDNITLAFSGAQPVNASLQLLESAGMTNDWTVAAELPPMTSDRAFVLGRSGDGGFYFARASESSTPMAAQGMPIVSTATTRAYMGSSGGLDGLAVQLEGAGVQEGMTGYLVSDGTAYVSHVDDAGKLVFDVSSSVTNAAIYLVVPAGATNGNIRIASPAVASIDYPDALITEVVADTPVNDGFASSGFASEYRIPALVSDGEGEVLCCYDVRYGATDLGYYYGTGTAGGIDIGETRSADGGRSFAAPKIAVDVPNFRRPDGVYPYGSAKAAIAKTNDLGDVSLLYDPETEKYWMMGITGGGLSTVRYNPDTADVVLYTRDKGKDSPWVAWNNGLGSKDPLEYRSIKYQILDQPGITNGVGLGSGFLQGPGHGMVTKIGKAGVMPVGTLVFPVQYFLNGSTVGAVYSKDHGTNWIATARSTDGTSAQENCVMELDDGSWYMTAKAGSRPGTGRFQFFRSKDYATWTKVGERSPVPCQQGSCLRLGKNGAGVGQYVYCHTLHPDTATRSQVALVFGSDTTHDDDPSAAPSATNAGVAWDDASTLMLYYDNTGFKGYNSLCMVDEKTLGVLYEAQGHIYFVRIDVSDRLR